MRFVFRFCIWSLLDFTGECGLNVSAIATTGGHGFRDTRHSRDSRAPNVQSDTADEDYDYCDDTDDSDGYWPAIDRVSRPLGLRWPTRVTFIADTLFAL